MLWNGKENDQAISNNNNLSDVKPIYAVEHLVTFRIKNEAELKRAKDKLKALVELDKTGGIWPMKMYMCFSGHWLLILDSDMKEIENFPGALITAPTAFTNEDPMEVFNNILVFSVTGISLGYAETHFFQVSDVSAVHMVEDLKLLSSGKALTPIKLLAKEKSVPSVKDHYGIAVAAAEVAAEKNNQEKKHVIKDVKILNHCFEDIERFVVRLQYAVEALLELEQRNNEHNSHGEGLLIARARPPTRIEFTDILAKHKLAFNYMTKLKNHFEDPSEPAHNSFVSLQTIVSVCNGVYVDEQIAENVVDPLLRRETIIFLNNQLNDKELNFWKSLGRNWTQSEDKFKDRNVVYHPIFYDEWSPDWIVDQEVPVNNTASPNLGCNATWILRLKSRNVKMAEVVCSKLAGNDKELKVAKGEYLEIIDDSRNWWKARNAAGSIGYVPRTILSPTNFEPQCLHASPDTDSSNSSAFEVESHESANYCSTLITCISTSEREVEQHLGSSSRTPIPRSYSMPNVPIPPPMPPPSDPNTPIRTLEKNKTERDKVSVSVRNDGAADGETPNLQHTINDELKLTLMQRERRKYLEILKTPQIYINQQSSSAEVVEWLRGKGFSDVIIEKLSGLNGDRLFALSPHVIEGYFGQKESRRLISQIVLQKNICEYKTMRSCELSAKLARARQKVENEGFDPNEVY